MGSFIICVCICMKPVKKETSSFLALYFLRCWHFCSRRLLYTISCSPWSVLLDFPYAVTQYVSLQMRLGTILLHACMETQLAFMNHFPLFALMLRAKDPWRLPGNRYCVLFLLGQELTTLSQYRRDIFCPRTIPEPAYCQGSFFFSFPFFVPYSSVESLRINQCRSPQFSSNMVSPSYNTSCPQHL